MQQIGTERLDNWVSKVTHRESCKKFKFDHTNKWYMRNPAPVLENETHKLLWDFEIQTDHLTSKLKECKKDKYLDLARELKKLWNMKVTIIPFGMVLLVQSQKDWYKDWRIDTRTWT